MANSQTHLQIEGITKNFGDFTALSDINIDIERGSFVCLLGPSGCGKTTLLRIIAGFETANSGRMLLDGVDISATPPHKRGFGMVFQSLALFPHMSVADNIAYGLKLRGVDRAKRLDRVEELLEVIELPAIADRPVSALSGGQRQRVAIARALAIQPKLFLLDEPLSALDAKLRENMQIELRQLQRKFGVTTILVTHDQTEAMMLADKLVVMEMGHIRQSAEPSVVYRQPSNLFVADFLGAANIIDADVVGEGNLAMLGTKMGIKTDANNGTSVKVALRAEHVALVPQNTEISLPSGTVEFVRDLGASLEYVVSVQDQKLRVRSSTPGARTYALGEKVGLVIKPEDVSVF